MEDRIIALETAVAFHEHTIAELNDFISEQQKQLQTLEAEVLRLAEKVGASEDGEAPEGQREPPPPHY